MSFTVDVLRLLRAAYFILQDRLIWLAGHLLRHGDLVRKQFPGRDPRSDSKLAAVYVHFDQHGVVHDYVLYQLQELVDAGCRVTFVSNSPIFPDPSYTLVAPFCRTVIWRFNTGYDFGAYKDGICALGDLAKLDGLVLMNDSVYGPFTRLSTILAAIDTSRYDFWGIVDSWEIAYHLQSFFLLFSPRALRSPAFETFWRRLPYINSKNWVIRNGEIGLTQALVSEKLRAGSLVSYWPVTEKKKDRLAELEQRCREPGERIVVERLRRALLVGRPVNPMHYFWDVLITDYDCPFIKRELLRSNVAGVPFTALWPDVIGSHTSYDVSMIERHLKSRS